MIIPIRTLGDPVLKTSSKPVERFDESLRHLVEDMFATMYDAPGVGLAAPQVGQNLRLFVMNHTGEPADNRVYVIVVEGDESLKADDATAHKFFDKFELKKK